MPYKNPADKLAWRRKYKQQQSRKHEEWYKRNLKKRRSLRKAEGRAEKRANALAQRKAEKENQKDIRLVPYVIAEIRRHIPKRDGLAVCKTCKTVKPVADLRYVIDARYCLECAVPLRKVRAHGNAAGGVGEED